MMTYQIKETNDLWNEVKLLAAIFSDNSLLDKIQQEVAWNFDNAHKPAYTGNDLAALAKMRFSYRNFIQSATGNSAIA